MTSDERQKWAQVRERGMLRYVLASGVLAWGMPMFVIMTFVVHHDRVTPKYVAISSALWFTGGLLFGLSMWYLQERKYRQAHD